VKNDDFVKADSEFITIRTGQLLLEVKSLHTNQHLEEGYQGLIDQAPVMQNFFNLIEKVAIADVPIVITGQCGTGKELVARMIHDLSSRCQGPFVKVNCAVCDGNLLESELFGYVKGAFIDADNSRIGRLEAAQGGTIFLNDIGEIPLAIQIKLLRMLEEKEIERVGANSPIKIDVRIISASNKNLEELIANGRFREDLYFRLNVFPIACPPLCDHAEDIPIIVNHLIQRNNLKTGKNIAGATSEAIDKMMVYAWPGNVRELQNVIDYAFTFCSSTRIDIQHLPAVVGRAAGNMNNDDLVKRAGLIRALRQSGGNRSEAARILGISRVTVWKQITKFGIDIPRELAV
jgi:two-component system, NtrC family, response regulator HydG